MRRLLRRVPLPLSTAAVLRRRIRRPNAHWGLLAFTLVMILALLVIQGVTTKTTGASGANLGSAAGAPLAGSRAVVHFQDGKLVSSDPPPGRRIALTFDDGPNPTWTPKIIAVLRQYGVPATFFVVGSQVALHADLLREEHRLGYEIANHTFTHAELSSIPLWERSLELSMTETAVAGVIGIKPRLMRPPYSSDPASLTETQYKALLPLAQDGYLIVLADLVSEDWARPGVGTIVANATPSGSSGGVLMMHDAGGNRAETVAALKILIPRLKARGFQFVYASDLAGEPRSAVELPASGGQRLRGHLLLGGLLVARVVTLLLNIAVVIVGVLVALRMLALLLFARAHARRRRSATPDPDFTPPVTIVVPAYNEVVGIGRAVHSLATGDYPGSVQVLVVDDGSTDGSADAVEALGLPGVRVLRQENAGKATALNRGIALAGAEIVVTVDADTVFEPQTLRRLVQGFRDPRVGAVSGNTKVGNRGGLLGRWQHIEYVMGFNLDRRMYEVLNCMPTVPGAIGAFRREALAQVGGVSGATLAEDTDITMDIGLHGWRVVYVEDARAWTEAPETLGQLWRQRYRWAYGTIQSIWKHKSALRHPRASNIGSRALPYLTLFQVVLPVFAPVIDLFAIYGLLFLSPLTVLYYWGGFNLFQLVLALYAFRLDREPLRPLLTLPLAQFVYRQLMYLVVIESIISALQGSRLRWGHLERTGHVEVAS